jgi:hypothetical protein
MLMNGVLMAAMMERMQIRAHLCSAITSKTSVLKAVWGSRCTRTAMCLLALPRAPSLSLFRRSHRIPGKRFLRFDLLSFFNRLPRARRTLCTSVAARVCSFVYSGLDSERGDVIILECVFCATSQSAFLFLTEAKCKGFTAASVACCIDCACCLLLFFF